MKSLAVGLQVYQKRDYHVGVFLWILQKFSEYLFYRTTPLAAPEIIKKFH